jgi:hypothetical protein
MLGCAVSAAQAEAATMAANGFEVRRLSGAIGAEILGINLSAEPGSTTA